MKHPKPVYPSAEDVEAAFYAAFSRCDLEVMRNLWVRGDVVCVHPGAEPIQGYEAVVRSWRHIFSGAERPNVQIKIIQSIVSDDLVMHMVEEHIGSSAAPHQGAVVFATNVYRRNGQGWLMVAHNASVVRTRQAQSQTLQ